MVSTVSQDIKAISNDRHPKTTVYSSESEIRRPWQMIVGIAQNFVESRELAWRIFVRNLSGMYRQTLLGIFWAFLPPLANTAIWLFLKSQDVFHIGDTGVDSTVFILTGMILWQGFVEAFQIPANQLSSNKNMLSRLNFPRESLVLVGFAEVIFNLLIRGILLAPAFYWFGVPLHSGSLLALGTMILMIFWGMALGLFLMPIGALYKDVGRFIALVLPFWMIVTPLVYVAPPTFPGNLLNWLNPASPLILVSRDLLLLGTTSHQTIGIVFGVLTLPLFILGMMVYRISLPILIERMAA